MKNIERIIFYIILVGAIAIAGVLIYDKTNNYTVDLLNEHIAELESDKERHLAELDIIGDRIITIQKTLEEFELENIRLKDILERSSRIAGEVEEENRAIAESIGRSLAIVRSLKADCQGQ